MILYKNNKYMYILNIYVYNKELTGGIIMYKKFFKRIIDILVALISIIVLSPILLIVSISVAINLGLPISFKQQRPGKDGKIFNIYKFRTMTNEKDINGYYLSDNIRLTKFGKFLRRTSLDELPQLFNILKGDMSIVGPRPLITDFVTYYTVEEKHRLDVRPGLTGLAQINGRSELPYEDRFRYDLQYIQNITFINDLKIFFKTIKKVIKKADTQDRGMDDVQSFFESRKKVKEYYSNKY